MLENLVDLVKQQAGDVIVNNPAIPNERNEEAISAASSSIFDGLKGALASGNIAGLTQLFNGNQQAASGVTEQIQGGFVQQLVEKFGLDHAQAGNIAGSLVPNVLQQLVHKTNDPNDSSFDLKGIIGSLSGGKGGFAQELMDKFAGGSDQQGGGLLGKIKGLFGG